MNLKYNYWYFQKAIKKEVCNKIITASLKKSKKKGTIENKKVNSKYRNCWVSWINDKWIYEIINPFIHSANRQAGWNFEWDWNECCQFTHYDKNQFYSWHCDQLTNSFKNSNKNIKFPAFRTISINLSNI